MNKLLTFGAACAALMSGPAFGQSAIDVTMVSGQPPVFLWVKHMRESFAPAVDEALKGTGHSINWAEAFGTLASTGGEMEAVEDGLAEVAVVTTVMQPTLLPLQNVTYYTPFGSPDSRLVAGVMDELHQTVPGLRESWHRYGIEYLGGGFAMENYVLMTKEPVTSVADLDGLKIGAPGPAVNWMAGTGAVGVASNITTYYNGLQTGVFDGVIVVPTAAAAARLHEVAPHITITDFGAQYAGSIVANGDWLQDQPDPVKDAMRAGATAFTSGFLDEQTRRVDAAMRMISGENPEMIHELSNAEKLRWASGLPDIAGTWADAAKAQGFDGDAVLNAYMAAIKSAGTELPRDWTRN